MNQVVGSGGDVYTFHLFLVLDEEHFVQPAALCLAPPWLPAFFAVKHHSLLDSLLDSTDTDLERVQALQARLNKCNL